MMKSKPIVDLKYFTKNSFSKSFFCSKLTGFSLLITVCYFISCSDREQAIPVIADFSIKVIDDDFSVPVHVNITNTSQGADTYKWSFQRANPASSTDRNPGTITYTEAGNHTITLEASNQDGSIDNKTITLPIDAEIIIGFDTEILIDNFPPMEVVFTNTTVGAITFDWTFQNGIPLSSSEQLPPNVVFNDPGEHTVILEVSNGLETYQKKQTVTVAPHLVAAFDYEIDFNDDDSQAPVTVSINNSSISATKYTWTFFGGTPSTSTDKNPTVTFNVPGKYTLELDAYNGKASQSIVSAPITVLPNTNIRSFENIKLGINISHNNNVRGAFFSTTTRKVYTQQEVNDENGASIDITFFGLNKHFTLNKFVSPHQAQTFSFDAIPNAGHTKFINLQESCNCSASMSETAFDNMIDDTLLAKLTVTETTGGTQGFDDSTIPRIVIFETDDERKGVIKIKKFVVDDQGNAYIIIDIKVQKEHT